MCHWLAVIASVSTGLWIVALIIGGVHWEHRHMSRKAWERVVAEREQYVRDGCPVTKTSDYGGEVLRGDPFLLDLANVIPLDHFPDLWRRNREAGAQWSRTSRFMNPGKRKE